MLTERVMAGTGWLMGGRIMASFVGFLSTILLARLLTPEDFGLVAICMSVFLLISSAFEIPTSIVLIQLPDASEDDFSTAWTISILKSLFISAVVLLAAGPAADIFDEPKLVPILQFMALYPIILGLRNSYFEQFAKNMDFSREVIVDITSKVVSFIVTLVIAFTFRSYWALVIGLVATGVVSTSLTFIMLPRLPRLTLKSFKRIFGFSAWLTGVSIVNQMNMQLENLAAIRIFGVSMLGQMSVGSTFVLRLQEAFGGPLFRSLLSAFSLIQNDVERLRRAYLSSQAFVAAIMLPISFGLGAVAYLLIPLLLGDQWDQAAHVVTFLGPMIGFLLLSSAVDSIIVSRGMTRTMFLRNLVVLLIKAVMIYLGIMFFGFDGLLAACLLGSVALVAINCLIVRRITKASVVEQIMVCHRSLIAVSFMYVAAFAISWFAPKDGHVFERLLALGVAVSVGGVVYVGVHLGLWLVQGRPEGPESRMLGYAGKAQAKLRAVLSRG